jgi:endonuclease VIII
MPEGDTIHHAASRIRAVLEGQTPTAIITPHPRHSAACWPERLAGRRVGAVDAYGKHLFVRFDGGLTLHSHLRMTGAWDVHREGARWRRASHRAWLVIRVTRDTQNTRARVNTRMDARGLVRGDARRRMRGDVWGQGQGNWEIVQFDGPVLELVSDRRLRADPRIAALGPDILGEGFDAQVYIDRLRAGDATRTFGEALLDQRVLAGLGTVWRSESCWALELDPWRSVSTVSDAQVGALAAWAREHMLICVHEGFRARPHSVYRRPGRQCPRCGEAIRGRGMGEENRIVYWCPGCQR